MPAEMPRTSSSAIELLEYVASLIRDGLHVEKISFEEGEALSVSVTCVAPSHTKEAQQVSCPACGATDGIRDAGRSSTGRNLDLLCIRCNHAWQIPQED